MSYLWVTVGSALGGLLRYSVSKLMVSIDLGVGFPIGTVLIKSSVPSSSATSGRSRCRAANTQPPIMFACS